MRRLLIIFIAMIAAQFCVVGLAQQDKLEGRWEGKVRAPQGERDAAVTFKKQGENYTGTTTGMRGDDIPLKEIKVDGNKVTAVATVESPQGSITIDYKFELQGEALKGEGSVDFGGQTITFTYDLKRAGEKTAAAQAPSEGQSPPQRQARPRVEQPTQKQTLDYFAGQSWAAKACSDLPPEKAPPHSQRAPMVNRLKRESRANPMRALIKRARPSHLTRRPACSPSPKSSAQA
jgi:hypothetical protein